jgi:hypothetical protein
MPAGQVGDSKSAGTKGASSTATANDPPTLSDPQSIYLAKENPFFATHIEKAVKHTREAEIAGNLGQAPELLQHAQLSLAQAREAQRAGSVPGLNEGIAFLRKALALPMQDPMQASPSLAQGVDPQCIDELGRQCGEVQPGGGRIQKCFDDKINNFSPMCQQQLKEGKAEVGAAIVENRHQKELTASPSAANSVQEATNYVREARKNFSQAGGIKFVDLKPQAAAPTR